MGEMSARCNRKVLITIAFDAGGRNMTWQSVAGDKDDCETLSIGPILYSGSIRTISILDAE